MSAFANKISQINPAAITSIALLVIRVFAAVAGALVTFLLARILPVDEVGMVLALISAATLASVLVTLNLEAGAVKYVVGGSHQRAFIRFNRSLILALTLPVAIGTLWLLDFRWGGLFSANPILAGIVLMMIPALGFTRATARQAGALQQVLRGGGPQLAIRPAFVLIALLFCLLTQVEANIQTIMSLFLIGILLTLGVQFYLLSDIFAALPKEKSTTQPKVWLTTGLCLAPALLYQDLFRDVILILAAIGLESAEIGQLGVALTILSLPGFALVAIEMGFAPTIAKAISRNSDQDRDRLLRSSARLRILLALPAIGLVAAIAGPIVHIFGPDYAMAAEPLRLFLLIPLARIVFGNAALILILRHAHRQILFATGAGLLVLVIGVPLAATIGGATGVAITASIIFMAVQAVLYALCRKLTGIDPSVLSAVPALRAKARAST